MYPTYDANKISSLGTPYALADSYKGYGECAKKLQNRTRWSPSTSPSAVVVDHIYPQENPVALHTYAPNIRNYPLVLETFKDQPMRSSESCGMYACAPGTPVYATIPVSEGYESDDRVCSKESSCVASGMVENMMIVFASIILVFVLFSWIRKDE